MEHFLRKIVVIVLGLIPFVAVAQLQQTGGIASFSLSKEFGKRFEISAEQELRLDRNFTSINRSSTSVGAEYVVVKGLLRVQAAYDLHYRRNNDEYYEFRHRASAGLVLQQDAGRFSFRWRTRGQLTYRDENQGDYSYNPKYVWRNRLQCNYDIPRSAFRPYVSVEVFCPINSKNGFFMDSYRLIAGTRYRVSRQHSLDFQLRFDQDIQQKNPVNILYLGVGWSYALR